MSLLKRLFERFLYSALATLIGGPLFTHFQFDRGLDPSTVKVIAAFLEMMQLLRSEHGLIVPFAKAAAANERRGDTIVSWIVIGDRASV
jgi:hypothetical protein